MKRSHVISAVLCLFFSVQHVHSASGNVAKDLVDRLFDTYMKAKSGKVRKDDKNIDDIEKLIKSYINHYESIVNLNDTRTLTISCLVSELIMFTNRKDLYEKFINFASRQKSAEECLSIGLAKLFIKNPKIVIMSTKNWSDGRKCDFLERLAFGLRNILKNPALFLQDTRRKMNELDQDSFVLQLLDLVQWDEPGPVERKKTKPFCQRLWDKRKKK